MSGSSARQWGAPRELCLCGVLALPGLSLTAQSSFSIPKGKAPPWQHPGDRDKKWRTTQGGQSEQPLRRAQPLQVTSSWGWGSPTQAPSQCWAMDLSSAAGTLPGAQGTGESWGTHSLSFPPHSQRVVSMGGEAVGAALQLGTVG